MKLRRKNHFLIPEKTAIIYSNKSYTNIFITLTDLKRRVIISKSSGMSAGISHSKRRKIVPQAVEFITKDLYKYLKLYGIKIVRIILKIKVNVLFHYLLKELAYYNIMVKSFSIRRPVASNGTRGRKIRRR